jgi:hypothetical protein
MPARPRVDAPATFAGGVRLLHWPADEPSRAELARNGAPRILLLGAGAAPPEHWDDLEDWVRLPLDHDELRTRARTLRRRARAGSRPELDDGFVRVGDRWIDLPPGPAAVVALLVERFGELVRTDEIAATYLDHGGSVRESARKAMIVRLRRRLVDLRLVLHNVRDSGYLLDWDDEADGATAASDAGVAS